MSTRGGTAAYFGRAHLLEERVNLQENMRVLITELFDCKTITHLLQKLGPGEQADEASSLKCDTKTIRLYIFGHSLA